jgi:hypothetical protein
VLTNVLTSGRREEDQHLRLWFESGVKQGEHLWELVDKFSRNITPKDSTRDSRFESLSAHYCTAH